MEIEEYNVCTGETAMQLSRAVMAAIRDGWQPFGSMVTSDGVLQQPVVRYKDPEA